MTVVGTRPTKEELDAIRAKDPLDRCPQDTVVLLAEIDALTHSVFSRECDLDRLARERPGGLQGSGMTDGMTEAAIPAMTIHLIIAGSRGFPKATADRYLMQLDADRIAEVVSGTCRGPDMWGEEWAAERGIPIKRMPADWARLGRRAGPERNRRMLDYARGMGGGLLVFWDGSSRGTRHIIEEALKLGMVVRVVLPDWEPTT